METINFNCLKRRFCVYDNMYLYNILILLYIMLTALAYEIDQLKMTKA